jgi:hypothetical protein
LCLTLSSNPPTRSRKASLCVRIPLEVSISNRELFKDLFIMIRALKVTVNFLEIVDINRIYLKKVVCL